MPQITVGDLGAYIREQRKSAQLSLRQLSRSAGVSNPYLSQIERGLRHPSAEILQQIAKALRISAEALYVRAGILEEPRGSASVTGAILADRSLNERQQRALIEVYHAFCAENAGQAAVADAPSGSEPVRPLEPPDEVSEPAADPGKPAAVGVSTATGASSLRPPRRMRAAKRPDDEQEQPPDARDPSLDEPSARALDR